MPINIHGKQYVTVAERLAEFHEKYPNGYIETEVTYDGPLVRCKAVVHPDIEKPRRFSGHSEEDNRNGQINKTSATENAETSAIGRALGIMGIGLIGDVASANEVVNAISQQEATYEPIKEPKAYVAKPLSDDFIATDKRPSKEQAAELKALGIGAWRKVDEKWVWFEKKGTAVKTAETDEPPF